MARILVIDDDDFVRTLVKRALTRDGHTVVDAADGDAGMELLREGGWDLVVTDIVMPGKEGIELIMEIREGSPDLPILAISGGGGGTAPQGPLRDARMLGADAALAKPFELEALSRLVSELLSGRREG